MGSSLKEISVTLHCQTPHLITASVVNRKANLREVFIPEVSYPCAREGHTNQHRCTPINLGLLPPSKNRSQEHRRNDDEPRRESHAKPPARADGKFTSLNQSMQPINVEESPYS